MNIQKFKSYQHLAALIVGLLPLLSFAQLDPQTIFQQIAGGQSDLLKVAIEADFHHLFNDETKEAEVPATMTIEKGKENIVYPVDISLRGKFRRRICDFPPIRLDFSKKLLRGMGLLDHDKLKLVTHCMEDRLAGNANVVKEYLAYQLYNVLSPNSFQVTMVKLSYVDLQKSFPKTTRYAIIIEDTDEMCERVGGTEYEAFNPDSSSIAALDENRLALFQYMIGNEDWSIAMMKNVKSVQQADGTLIPVPYDFDFSGFVNASYARPNFEAHGHTSITQRAFLGLKTSEDVMRQNIDHYKNKKAELLKVIDDCKYLSKPARQDAIEYLESFYAEIDQLMMHCKAS